MIVHDAVAPSGNGYKVHLALSQLGIAYETRDWETMATPSETRTAPFLAKNPNGRIPVLELDDGTCLPESNAILWYLGEGTPLVPDGRIDRARVLQWMFFEQYSHEPYIAVYKYWLYWGGLDKLRAEEIEKLQVRGQAALDVMATHLETNDFFAAGRYTIADIALFAYTQSAETTGFDVKPAVRVWMERVRSQPGYVRMKADPHGKAPQW